MAKKGVIFIFTKDGDVLMDFDASAGQACVEKTEAIIRRLRSLGVELDVQEQEPKVAPPEADYWPQRQGQGTEG